MNKDVLIRFLQSSNLISFVAANEIAAVFTQKTLIKNQLHLTAGKISDEYLFLEQGYMRAFAHDLEGSEVTTNFCTPGQLVFEVSSFFNRTKSKENIQALTDCAGWHISYKQLNDLFHRSAEFREFGRSVLVRGYAGLKTRTLAMITETAEERYEALLRCLYSRRIGHREMRHCQILEEWQGCIS